eukprot:CAMPEP_0177660202 /NCGR_PEP_ID=MMETSP0447-20121125/17893_1 /TAXON_ID=0 /ORGANISM="Stygamoeba regulata, Strain BSH-02190019" /LENGTH=276 /DNA_ID=CAMNT_0019165209 /DNA_START=206 /DNA_END=1036 /DNA_ORIENTATION=-
MAEHPIVDDLSFGIPPLDHFIATLVDDAGALSQTTKLALAVASFALFFSEFLVLRVVLKHVWPAAQPTLQFANRFTAMTHGVIITLLAAILCWDAPVPHGFGLSNTPEQDFVFCVSLGYFANDQLSMSLFGLEDDAGGTLLHHASSLLVLIYTLISGQSGCELLRAAFLLEATNPNLHIRWMLRSFNMSTSAVYMANDAMFMVLFTLFRVVVGLPLTYLTVSDPGVSMFVKISALGMQGVSLFWFFTIMRKTLKIVKRLIAKQPKVKKADRKKKKN